MSSTSIGPSQSPNLSPIQSEGRDSACKEICDACKIILKRTYELAQYIFCCKKVQSAVPKPLTQAQIKAQELNRRADDSSIHRATRNVVLAGGNTLRSLGNNGLDIAEGVINAGVLPITNSIIASIPFMPNSAAQPIANSITGYVHNTSTSLKESSGKSVDSSETSATEASFDAYDGSGKLLDTVTGIFKRNSNTSSTN